MLASLNVRDWVRKGSHCGVELIACNREERWEGSEFVLGQDAKVLQSSAIPQGEKRKSPKPDDSLEVLFGFDFTSGGRVR
ncbi:hypothetical protein S83_001456, partial [Arachis hypogaea]